MSKIKLGVALFILSEANFFALLIVAYAYFHTLPAGDGPTAASVLNVSRTSLYSVLLFSSSITMALAGRAYRKSSRDRLIGWLLATIALGGVFLFGQALEYIGLYRTGVVLERNLFATTFFTVTGFHGLHVFIGLCVLAIVAGVTMSGRFGDEGVQAEAFEAVGWYWHFVDLVWVAVFSVVYLWAFI